LWQLKVYLDKISFYNRHSVTNFSIHKIMSEVIAAYRSPVGLLTIKATNKTVSAVLFEKTGLNRSSENTAAETKNLDHPIIQKCCKQLQEYFEGSRKQFDLPLEQSGTLFQQKVWNELLKINYGKTISYLELSKRIGDVKAIRAVGTTNGKNKIAIIVPCHRVIGSNGDLTGYAGELWRKRWLLEHEAKFGNGVQTLF
jgi:methylated-DNA-[protein]-cysteine S-methyltransferase